MKIFDHAMSLEEQNISLCQLKQEIYLAFHQHWELNDKAHRQKHFEEVLQCGLKINQTLKLGFDPKLILFGAYFHDLFAWSRNNHHLMSGDWMTSTNHPLIVDNLSNIVQRRLDLDDIPEHLHDIVNNSERFIVATACREHRASFKGVFTTSFSELINSADRGEPKGIKDLVERAYQFRIKSDPRSNDKQRMMDSVAHVKEKYGSDGYARYPLYYRKCFSAELEKQQKAVDELSVVDF